MRPHVLDYHIMDSGKLIIAVPDPSHYHLSISTETASGPQSFNLKLEIENSPSAADTAPTVAPPNDNNGPSERYANAQRRKELGYGQAHSQLHAMTPLIGKKQQPYGSNDSGNPIPHYASSWYPKSINREHSTPTPSSTAPTSSPIAGSPATGNKASNTPSSPNPTAPATSPNTSPKISIRIDVHVNDHQSTTERKS